MDNGERLLPPGELTEALQEAELVADRAEQARAIADHRAEQEKTIADQRADQADRRADRAEQQAALLRQKLRDLGIDPNIDT